MNGKTPDVSPKSDDFLTPMKTFCVSTLALAAASSGLWAAPRLFVSTPLLQPESTVELILDQPVIPTECPKSTFDACSSLRQGSTT